MMKHVRVAGAICLALWTGLLSNSAEGQGAALSARVAGKAFAPKFACFTPKQFSTYGDELQAWGGELVLYDAVPPSEMERDIACSAVWFPNPPQFHRAVIAVSNPDTAKNLVKAGVSQVETAVDGKRTASNAPVLPTDSVTVTGGNVDKETLELDLKIKGDADTTFSGHVIAMVRDNAHHQKDIIAKLIKPAKAPKKK